MTSLSSRFSQSSERVVIPVPPRKPGQLSHRAKGQVQQRLLSEPPPSSAFLASECCVTYLSPASGYLCEDASLPRLLERITSEAEW